MSASLAALKDLVAEHKIKVLWLMLLLSLAQSLSVIIMILVGKVVDALATAHITLAYQLVAIFATAAVLSSIISTSQLALRDHMFHHTVGSLAMRWCRGLLNREHYFFKSCDIGALISSYSRGLDTRYRMYVLMWEHAFYHILKTLFIAAYITYLGGTWMLMILSVTTMIFALASQGLIRLRRTHITHLNQARDLASAHQAGLIAALPSLQSAGASALALHTMSRCTEKMRKQEVICAFFSNVMQGLHFVFPAITSAVILYLALRLDVGWQVGDFVAAFLLIADLMRSIHTLMDVPPAMDEQIEHQKTILSAVDVVADDQQQPPPPQLTHGDLIIAPFIYPINDQGVQLSCEERIVIPAKMHVAIMGATGQGKTTLAEMICGIRKIPGAIFLSGTDVSTLSDQQQLLYFAQNPDAFLHGDFYQFTLIPDRHDPKMMAHLVQKLSLRQLKEQWNPDGSAHSSGEKKRLSLLRACLLHRPLTIFDEPTESLPASAAQKIWPLLTDHFAAQTLICLTHDPQAVRHFQMVLEIRNHRLVPIVMP